MAACVARCRWRRGEHRHGHAQQGMEPMGRHAGAQQYAGRQEHSHRVERRQVRFPDRRVGPGQGQEHQVGRQARFADLRQPGRRRRQGVRRHQQRAAAGSSAIPATSIWAACWRSTSRTANSSGSTAAKSCPPAASTTGRCRASAVRRMSKATGCGSSPAAAKSAASTPKASTTARTTASHQRRGDRQEVRQALRQKKEADVIWVYDMMKEMGVSQHNMAAARSPARATCCSSARRTASTWSTTTFPRPRPPASS